MSDYSLWVMCVASRASFFELSKQRLLFWGPLFWSLVYAVCGGLIPVIGTQVATARKAMAMKGVDRHMMGLKLAAVLSGKAPHPFFASPGCSLTWQLSTSQTPLVQEYVIAAHHTLYTVHIAPHTLVARSLYAVSTQYLLVMLKVFIVCLMLLQTHLIAAASAQLRRWLRARRRGRHRLRILRAA